MVAKEVRQRVKGEEGRGFIKAAEREGAIKKNRCGSPCERAELRSKIVATPIYSKAVCNVSLTN